MKHNQDEAAGLPLVRARTAGVDIGANENWVCAPSLDGTRREVQRFGATTHELEKLAAWLCERQVEGIAMESTGVYWIPLHEILERQGFDVLLVNTRQLARVPGRTKSDRLDCEWIQRLHSCGLLSGAFRPDETISLLRTLVRDKARMITARADWLKRMQKSLDQMNVRVHRAVSKTDGETGLAIIAAIVNGERDPLELAKLRHQRCAKSEQEIAEQLRGHWREDHLFSLEQSFKMYAVLGERILEYEREIERRLARMEPPERRGKQAPPLENKNKEKGIRRRGEESLRHALFRATGRDLTQIDAIGVSTANVVLSEYGPDLSRFPSERQFISHLTLAPYKPVSGGKPVKKRKKPSSASSRVATALRMAAVSLAHSQTALGAYYRRISRRKGADVAVFATARKLAQHIYRMLRWGQPYLDQGVEAYEARYQQARLARLSTNAKDLGLQLVPLPKTS